MAIGKHGTAKAQITRASLVSAAAEILRETGPSAVSYRKTAERAKAAPSSVGYYFESIDDLLCEAAIYNMDAWLEYAEEIAQYAESLSSDECMAILDELVVKVCLPEGFSTPVAHYQQLIGASSSDVVVSAYRKGRIQIDSIVKRIVCHAGISITNPRIVSSLIDGAAILAITQGANVQEYARETIGDAFSYALKHRNHS